MNYALTFRIAALVPVLSISLTDILPAATGAYEPFNYPTGILTGQNGGTGFSGGWVASRGTSTQGNVWNEITNVTFAGESPSLVWNGALNNSFPTYPTIGARYVGATNSGSSDLHICRTLASSAGAMAGTDGVLWLSAVYHVANSGYGAGVNIGLGNGYVYDRGRSFSVTPGAAASSTVSFIGVNGYTGSAWNTKLNPMVTAGSWTSGQYAWTTGPTALTTTADMIVLLKFTFGTSDKVEAAYFTENESLSEASFNTRKASSIYAAGIDENSLTVLSISQGRMANAIDEIRIGRTFNDVISPSSNFEYDQWAAHYPGLGLPGDDNDGDSLTNDTERALGTNPLLADTDGDGYADGTEVAAGSFPMVAASTPLDTDGDGLPNAWEIANFGNLGHDGTADSDNDTLIDSLEYTFNLNPNDPDTNHDGYPDWMGIPGYLYVEQWNNIPGETLQDLYNSAGFRGTPDDVYMVTQAKSQSNVGDNFGLRMRGRVIAPVTGTYHFWIASDGPSSLFLSTDSTAFKRRLIASVKVASGEEQWDQDPSQKSIGINLVGGQEYNIEALMKESSGPDHLAIAWDYPGQTRQIIPGAQLKSYITDAGDADGDGMLDTWESSVGLNPHEDGHIDPSQSAYADPDGDSLLNFEEYNYNGNPQSAGGNLGYLELGIWKNISGSAVKDLTSNAKFNSSPDIKVLTGADVSGLGINYGARLRGTIKAPQNGDYVFYIAADEQAELWISSTDAPFARRRVAYSTTKTNPQQWLPGTRQTAGIHLEQGKSYYIEALVKNANGSDHLSIGWSCLTEADWQVANIGSGNASSWSVISSTGSVNGTTTGGDIRYASDKCAFRYIQLQGDCEMTARIQNLDSTNASAKAGLMIRESLSADSTLALMHLTKDGRIALHQRAATGGQTTQAGSLSAGQPFQWLRINRTGNVLTGSYSLDGKTWKTVGSCTITMGQSVYVGMATASTANNIAVEADWDHIGFTDLSRVTLIPTSALASFSPSPLDQDDDGLPDAWEIANGLSANTGANGHGCYGDPDGDHVSNYEEYLLGSNPQFNGAIPGNLTRELWPSLSGDTFLDVVTSPTFLHGNPQEPGSPSTANMVTSPTFLHGNPQISLLPASEQITLGNTGGVQRVRGTVTAPVTGDYRFYISGYSDCELWLNGSGASKFGKRKIACLYENDPGGMYEVTFRGWGKYATQLSQPIHLQAGQSYFIEILQMQSQGSGHFSVAWSYTDSNGQITPQGLIPASQLASYQPNPDDCDDDYLPDSWEVAKGLNAADNGYADRIREGDYGDYDSDGLTNREEYLLGTNPANADTDGDGLNDFDEARRNFTDPNRANDTQDNVVALIQPGSVGGLGSRWVTTDGGVTTQSFRGEGVWEFTAPADGFWIIRIDTRLLGNLQAGETMPVQVKIDGKFIALAEIFYKSGDTGYMRVSSNYLSAGIHQLGLFFDNYMARRKVEVTGISLIAPPATDTDQNGIPDAVENFLKSQNKLSDQRTLVSHVSPLFIEGMARGAESYELRAYDSGAGTVVRNSEAFWNTNLPLYQADIDTVVANLLQHPFADRSSAGAIQPTNAGAGLGTWFANLELQENQATSYAVFFENGAMADSGVASWQPLNLAEHSSITIPVGSKLLMGVWNTENDQSMVDYSVDDTAIGDAMAAQSISQEFSYAGHYTVKARHEQSDVTYELNVTVEGANFPGNISLGERRTQQVNLPGVKPHLIPDSGGELIIDALKADGAGGSQTYMAGLIPGQHRTAIRMSDGGPILDIKPVNVVGVSDALRNDADRAVAVTDGLIQIESPLLITNMPAGGYAIVTIFRAGVTFLDGTTVMTLHAEDLDENGVKTLGFYFPAGMSGGYCHYVDVYDASGKLVYHGN